MIFWVFTPAKIIIYQSIHASDLAGFSTRVRKISRLLNKFEVWVSCEAVCDIFGFVFLFDFLKKEFNYLLYLLNTGFAVIEIGSFYGGEHLTFVDKMAMFV